MTPCIVESRHYPDHSPLGVAAGLTTAGPKRTRFPPRDAAPGEDLRATSERWYTLPEKPLNGVHTLAVAATDIDMTKTRDVILQELAREEQRLAEIERTHAEARTGIALLRSQLAATSATATPLAPAGRPLRLPIASNGVAPHARDDKVKLFRSLFRGRPDIFPTRFVSKKTGKAGFAPACANKWEPGLCALKTGGRCSDCAHQAFVPVGDQVVLDHLQGRHVIGVYALLEDETCWFVAADFDKGSWQEDVSAFSETCHPEA